MYEKLKISWKLEKAKWFLSYWLKHAQIWFEVQFLLKINYLLKYVKILSHSSTKYLFKIVNEWNIKFCRMWYDKHLFPSTIIFWLKKTKQNKTKKKQKTKQNKPPTQNL